MVAEAQERADRIVVEASNEHDRLVSDSEVYRVAKHEADERASPRKRECEALRHETDEYVDSRLANFEITLDQDARGRHPRPRPAPGTAPARPGQPRHPGLARGHRHDPAAAAPLIPPASPVCRLEAAYSVDLRRVRPNRYPGGCPPWRAAICCARQPKVPQRCVSTPRSPFVINTHELGRRPGSMQTLELSLPAPADLGIELLGVPEGSPVELDLRLEAVMEGVLASGRAWVSLAGECARCLDPIEDDLEVTLQELYVYPESDAEEDEASRTRWRAVRPRAGVPGRGGACAAVPTRVPAGLSRTVPRVRGAAAGRSRACARGERRPTMGRALRPDDSNADRRSRFRTSGRRGRGVNRGCSEAEDVAQQHAPPPFAVEGCCPLARDVRQPGLWSKHLPHRACPECGQYGARADRRQVL